MKVYVDPRCDIRYAAFYIYGLERVLGKHNVIFSAKYSKRVTFDEFRSVIDRILLCTFVDGDKVIRKVAIDSRDPRSFLEKAYQWCDIYAKSNFRSSEDGNKHKDKMFLIPPSFGFRLWGVPSTFLYGVYNTWLSFRTGNYGNLSDLVVTFQNYIWLILRRAELNDYLTPQKQSDCNNYAFFVASLWNYQECIHGANRLRYIFARSLFDDPAVNFEGGFVINSRSADIPPEYSNLCTKCRVKARDYIKKTVRSFVVFNTPAVRECHGWKLPEFLAMGKAIVSTPILNDLPLPLINREHLLIVHNEDDMQKAITELRSNPSLRDKLQTSAFNYWSEVARPEIVIRSILLKCDGLS